MLEYQRVSTNNSLVIVTTIPATLYHLLSNQIPYLTAQGMSVTLITSAGEWVTVRDVEKRYGVRVHTAPFTREYSILKDIGAIRRLYAQLKTIRPVIVHYSTPKAAFLCSLAAWCARIPRRVYTVRGMVYYGKKWPLRSVLECVEWLTCRLSTHVLSVSASNRDFIIRRRLCHAAKIRVLAHGSSQGVDARQRFNPANLDGIKLDGLRQSTGIIGSMCRGGFCG